MTKKVLLALFFFSLFSSNAYSEDSKGFDSKSDLRAGFYFKYGYDVFNSKNFTTPFNLTKLMPKFFEIGFQGENSIKGTSTISFSYFNNTKYFSNIGSNILYGQTASIDDSITEINQTLYEINLSSPINYKYEDPFEWGWVLGTYTQNIDYSIETGKGLVLGSYIKYSTLYPFVPYANLKILGGNFYDNLSLYQTRNSSQNINNKGIPFIKTLLPSSTGIKICYEGNFNIDWYINRNFIISAGYNMNNFDFLSYPFSNTEYTTQTKITGFLFSPKKEKLNNQLFNFSEHVNNLYLKSNFFF